MLDCILFITNLNLIFWGNSRILLLLILLFLLEISSTNAAIQEFLKRNYLIYIVDNLGIGKLSIGCLKNYIVLLFLLFFFLKLHFFFLNQFISFHVLKILTRIFIFIIFLNFLIITIIKRTLYLIFLAKSCFFSLFSSLRVVLIFFLHYSLLGRQILDLLDFTYHFLR